ncbi:TniB family NTP-binding protein [Sideroxydans sp.]
MSTNTQPLELFTSQSEQQAYEVVAKIDKIRVGHPFFEGALNRINECLKASVFSVEPVNCMLLGDGGMGKTSVANTILKSMKPEVIREDDLETITVPAFYASFKSSTSLDLLLTDMLSKLGDPHPNIGKETDKASRFYKLLIQCRTKIIFLDELHDIEGFDARKKKVMKKFFKVMKSISNTRGPVTCLMGIPECHDIFRGDKEMSRRFKRQAIMRELAPGTEGNPGMLQNFVSDVYGKIIESTEIKGFPTLSYASALQIYTATGGSPDYIMTLIKESVLHAMLNNRLTVEIGDFAKTWDAGLLNGSFLGTKIVVGFNPFLAKQEKLAKLFRGGV